MLETAIFVLTLSLGLFPRALGDLECRPEGSVVPPPRNLTESEIFRTATTNLTKTLEQAVTREIRAGFAVENTLFSVGLVSLGPDNPSTPVWEYHHLSPANVNGTKLLDKDSQYLIGSVSKVISDTILLRSGIDIDQTVTKFLPQLSNKSSLIDWENITLRALGSQLAGIPPNCEHVRFSRSQF